MSRRSAEGPDRRGAASAFLRRLLLAVIAVLYVASVPWYRTGDREPTLWLGLPDWVAVAVLCYGGIAVLNALAWLLTEVPDEPPSEDPR